MTESSSPFDARVEQLYLEFLTRLDRGEAPDFEALCELNPECATSLRQLRAAHEIASRAQPSAALLTERIRASHGPGVDPELSLGGVPKADADPPSALFERLRSRNPKGTRYRLLGEVGRGGMGVVLRIWDEDLRRTLAMKVVLGRDESATGDTPHVDPKTIGRFLEEAQVTGQLDHPGIVPVHELGLDTAGRVYFTMRLVKGEDLRKIYEHVESGFEDWNRTRALGVLLKVCDAMSYAHDKKVVHRDLKPANVMVGKYGEVYVMDWGLARVMGQADRHDVRLQPAAQGSTSVRTERRETRGETPDSPLVTMDGDVVGTPSYMPPEQARGELDLLGPHSDVYAVGAMLYQLIGGEMPYVPKNAKVSPYTVLMAVLNGPPRALSELAPRAPLELLAICERAMQREITERYRDTRELGDDLRAYLERRVVKAYETGTWAETKKWMQRNRAVSFACASLLIAMTGALYANQLRIEQSKLRATESERARLALAEVNLTLERKNAELRAERLDDMLRGMIQDLARLRAQSRTLDGLEHLGKPAYLWWIEETEGLLGGREEDSAHRVAWRPGLKDVRAELARLRALPALLAYTEEDAERDFQSHPDQYLLRRVEQREDSDEREVQLRARPKTHTSVETR
ncbi:MAG: serine/threonine protein kinase [Planctomycetes bacterium]|nr:serine/threonine protein kinase [Planctomycetota bacterium]